MQCMQAYRVWARSLGVARPYPIACSERAHTLLHGTCMQAYTGVLRYFCVCVAVPGCKRQQRNNQRVPQMIRGGEARWRREATSVSVGQLLPARSVGQLLPARVSRGRRTTVCLGIPLALTRSSPIPLARPRQRLSVSKCTFVPVKHVN
jgi:hypothetical protein